MIYHVWTPGDELPDGIPEGCEYGGLSACRWVPEVDPPSMWKAHPRRWPAEANSEPVYRCLPCCLPCPKCGSDDISRHHWRQCEKRKTLFSSTPRQSRWLGVGQYESVCKEECIAHHCRACHYEWETGVLEASG